MRRTLIVVTLLAALVVAVAVPVYAGVGRDTNLTIGRANGGKAYNTSLYSSNNTATLTLVNTRGAGSPALDLRVSAGPPMQVNSSGRVHKLNADYLDGYQAADMVMVDGCGRNTPDLVGQDWSCTMTLATNRAGYIAMNGSADVWNGDGVTPDTVSCDFQLGGGQARWSRRDVELGPNPTDRNEDLCATNTMVAVPKGTHTVVFRVYNVGPLTRVGNAGASVVFSAFTG
jgi:hypothetical protein